MKLDRAILGIILLGLSGVAIAGGSISSGGGGGNFLANDADDVSTGTISSDGTDANTGGGLYAYDQAASSTEFTEVAALIGITDDDAYVRLEAYGASHVGNGYCLGASETQGGAEIVLKAEDASNTGVAICSVEDDPLILGVAQATAGMTKVLTLDDDSPTVKFHGATQEYLVDTTVTLTGGVNGLNIDGISFDGTNDRIGIGDTTPDASIDIEAATDSGVWATSTAAGQHISIASFASDGDAVYFTMYGPSDASTFLGSTRPGFGVIAVSSSGTPQGGAYGSDADIPIIMGTQGSGAAGYEYLRLVNEADARDPGVSINSTGRSDVDFAVDTDNLTDAFRIDASSETCTMKIGTIYSGVTTDITSAGNEDITLDPGGGSGSGSVVIISEDNDTLFNDSANTNRYVMRTSTSNAGGMFFAQPGSNAGGLFMNGAVAAIGSIDNRAADGTTPVACFGDTLTADTMTNHICDYGGGLLSQELVQTCDCGTTGNPNTVTCNITSNLVKLIDGDANDCTVTIAETAAATINKDFPFITLVVTNDGTGGNFNIADSAGVVNVNGASIALGSQDTAYLMYDSTNDIFIQIGATGNN